MFDAEKVLDGYVECALWSSMDETDENTGGEPLDANYGAGDIADEAMQAMSEDVRDFLGLIDREGITADGWTDEQIGHDFWLTRNGHGAGFWDRGRPDGDALTKWAKSYGTANLYLGDDGAIYYWNS